MYCSLRIHPASFQWLFLVPLKGGRDYKTPQKAIYKWYILPIGGLYATYHVLGEPETTIDLRKLLQSWGCWVHLTSDQPHLPSDCWSLAPWRAGENKKMGVRSFPAGAGGRVYGDDYERVPSQTYHDFPYLDVPGSYFMVSKWVISPTYKWGKIGGITHWSQPLILTSNGTSKYDLPTSSSCVCFFWGALRSYHHSAGGQSFRCCGGGETPPGGSKNVGFETKMMVAESCFLSAHGMWRGWSWGASVASLVIYVCSFWWRGWFIFFMRCWVTRTFCQFGGY